MTPDPNYFWQFIACVAILASIGANIVQAVRGKRRDVSIVPGLVTHAELEKHDKNGHQDEFKSVRAEMQAALGASNQAGEMRAEKIHRRVNVILRGVSRIEGKLGIRPSAEEEIES